MTKKKKRKIMRYSLISLLFSTTSCYSEFVFYRKRYKNGEAKKVLRVMSLSSLPQDKP